MVSPRGALIAPHLDVVGLNCPRGVASVGDEFFQKRLHLGDAFGLLGGQVFGLTKVFRQVVELNGN